MRACPHAYSSELSEELRGLSDSTGLSLSDLIVAGGFTDVVDMVYGQLDGGGARQGSFEDDCTAVLVPDARARGAGFLAQA